MKKSFPLILIVLAALGIGYSFIKNPASNDGPSVSVNTTSSDQSGGSMSDNSSMGGESAKSTSDQDSDSTGDDESVDEVKPLATAYKSADEALEALKKGSKDYDDMLLEQFSNPGDDCTFCTELYSKIKDLLKGTELPNDQKSYMAEILAISGKVENVQSLIDGLKGSTKAEDKEVYSAALELVSGGDKVVKFLGDNLKTDNSELQESVVAALTNQGSALAFDTMMKHVVEKGDPDGYYSLGIGPGEMILDETALSKAQEIAQKRDAFAPLAVKALLNSGIGGLRIVMDILGNSSDPESDQKLLKDAVEHVNYDEQVEQYLKDKANSSNASVRDFATKILGDFSQTEVLDEGEEQQLQTKIGDGSAQ